MVSKDRIRKTCKIAISNILHEGITDVELFNDPFEIDLLRLDINAEYLCSLICSRISSNDFSSLKMHKIGHVLFPKKTLSDFRKCALIDVYDEVMYLTLVLLVSKDMEAMRINKANKKIFSYRFEVQENGSLFSNQYNYTSFRNEVNRKTNLMKNKVLVECDASNFYDRLNIHRIESILLSNPKIDKDVIKLINHLLLFWANRDSYGLPVGSNASRLLAEIALIEVDNYLISKKIDFCRFVDDYRIFAKDSYTAHSNLAILNLCLSREGMFLNNQKTKIKDISNEVVKIPFDAFDSAISSESLKRSFEISKIIRGYSGLIPVKFRELSTNQIQRLKDNDLKEMLNLIQNKIIIKPEEVTEIIKTIIAQEQYDELSKVPNILKNYPQFIPYFVDVMLKKGENMNTESLDRIQNDFKVWFEDENTPEYIQVYLVRLYASKIFDNKEILLETFRKLRRNSGDYIGRALLESLDGKLSRGELLEIKEYYYRADKWEERQIINMVNKAFSEGEKRPFLKDIKIHNDDIFVDWLIKSKSYPK